MKIPSLQRLALAGLALLSWTAAAAAPVAARLTTPWTAAVSPTTPWPEYPRPQLQRDAWTNLNGSWDYAVLPANAADLPTAYEGKILVPFAIESDLSGVNRRVGPAERLWYRRTFATPSLAGGQRLLLNFGAVNWRSEVFLNGVSVRRHDGGYDAFTVDLTAALKPGATQELVVAVANPVETGAQPRGKQLSHPSGIWYTPVTGIWQTVWLETVPEVHVADLVLLPDLDRGRVSVQAVLQPRTLGAVSADITVRAEGRVVATANVARLEGPVIVDLPKPRAWSPDDPFLYDVDVTVRAGDSTDRVHGYFGLRQVGIARAADGFDRIVLNHRPLFLLGPLDQGWWPDGLYTAPTDEALRWDIATMRELGFNVVRKHVKVEPARWYYHCDRLGLLVWQDLPSAAREGTEAHWVSSNANREGAFSPEEDAQFRQELGAMIAQHRAFPSIISWDPFNEGWGQHATNEILAWVKQLDPTRLVDGPSGWLDLGQGDMIDCHAYPGPGMLPVQPGRASVLGEFGGLGLPLPGHLWRTKDFWRTSDHANAEELTARYRDLLALLPPLVKRGLAAAIYTQLTDVEGEINGLVTYDRRVVKMSPATLAPLHRALISPQP